MAHRGHLDGLTAQAPALMPHGSFASGSLSSHSPLQSSSRLEMLENKLAMQTVEVEKLIMENQRLANSHTVLRQDIVDTEKEMQMIRTHLGEVQTDTDLQIRDLLERIRLMEADIHSGDAVKKELHQVHMEAKRLITERQMLTLEIENVTKELQKLSASGDGKSPPELIAELDGLRKEHHNLRSQFEFEKNTNIKQVEQMRTMEVNLISMTKTAEKLRGDLANAERRAQAAAQAAAHAAGAQVTASQPGTAQATAVSAAATDPYAGAYASYPSAYQHGAQAGAYQQGAQAGAYQQGTQAAYQQGTQAGAYQQGNQAGAYQQGNQAGAYTYAYDAAMAYAYAGYPGYPVAGYAQSAVPNYSYAVPPQPSSGAAADAASLYGTAGSAGYPTGQVQPSSATANAAQPPPPPPPGASYPGTYDQTGGAQR